MPTKIEWATETWNPVTGCSPISAGCQNCYAKRMATRLRGRYGYDLDDPFRVTVHKDRLDQPLRWKKPRRIFVCSMGDLFHDDAPMPFIDEILDVISATPHHTYILLTKRPENLEHKLYGFHDDAPCRELGGGDYLPNLWLGVTAENQKAADERIPILLQIPAAVRFVSVEPMLERIEMDDRWNCPRCNGTGYFQTDPYIVRCHGCSEPLEDRGTGIGIDWVICGGETGPGARPMNPDWARDLRDQCTAAGVPFFFKKLGAGRETPDDLMIRQWPDGEEGR